MGFCLLPDQANKFVEAINNGEITPDNMVNMTSAERRDYFTNLFGNEADAHEVNALLESKLILKDQQRGMQTWAKKLAGISESTRRDILSRIDRLNTVLTPENEKVFLEDLAAKKLGVDVTAEEATKIAALAKEAKTLEAKMVGTSPWSPERTAYGRSIMNLSDYVENLKPQFKITKPEASIDWWKWATQEFLALPKTALTSVLHFSAPFVQGWGMMSTTRFWEGAGQMFRYFTNPEAFKDLHAAIIAHPDYALAKEGKLGLTDLSDRLTTREEQIQSSLLQKIPGIRIPVMASSRAFVGFLNYVRFQRFVDLLNAARTAGEDVRPGSQVIKDLANTVNNFTGRASLGKNDRFASISPVLNDIFFAPRKIVATMQMFNPRNLLDPRISPTARKAALRQLVGSIIATEAVLSLAQLSGAKVNYNPTATNFLKIQIGKMTMDLTGGNAIYIRLLSRIVTQKSVSSTGKATTLTPGFGKTTAGDEVVNYIRGKFSPLLGSFADYLYGKDLGGNKFSLPSEVQNDLTPIVAQEFLQLYNTQGLNPAIWIPAFASVFGIQITSKK